MERIIIIGDEYSNSLSWKEKRSVANEIIINTEFVSPVNLSRRFVMFTGCPGSGKSTISAFLNERFGFNAIATDKIKSFLQSRGAFFAKPDLFHIQAMVFRYLFENSLDVASDSNSGLSRHRYKLRRMAEKYSYSVTNINVVCDPEICFRRVIARNAVVDPQLIEKWHKKIYEYSQEIQVPRNAITIDNNQEFAKVQSELLSVFINPQK